MDNIICCITLEPIKIPGITLYGSIYEYDAIMEWLVNHEIDPMTNIRLPNKQIHKLDSIENAPQDQLEKVKECANKIKNETLLWCEPYKLCLSMPIKYEKILNTKKIIDTMKQLNDANWLEHTKIILSLFRSGYMLGIMPDRIENLIDLIKITKGCQFLNISDITIRNGQYKSNSFDFATIYNCNFINCDFSRCTFIGTIIKDTIFINCTFIGEEIIFYKANFTNVIFRECSFEYLNVWVKTKNIEEIIEILCSRLLDESHTMLCTEENTLSINWNSDAF